MRKRLRRLRDYFLSRGVAKIAKTALCLGALAGSFGTESAWANGFDFGTSNRSAVVQENSLVNSPQPLGQYKQQVYLQTPGNGFQGQQQQFTPPPPPPPPPPVNAMQQQWYVQPQANGARGQNQQSFQNNNQAINNVMQNTPVQQQYQVPPPPPPPPPVNAMQQQKYVQQQANGARGQNQQSFQNNNQAINNVMQNTPVQQQYQVPPPPPSPPPVNGFQGQQQQFTPPPPPPPPPPVNAMQQQNYVQQQANGARGQNQQSFQNNNQALNNVMQNTPVQQQYQVPPPPPPPPPVNGFQGQQQNYVQPQANGFQGQQQQFIPPPPPPPPVNAMQQQNYVQQQANGFQGQQQQFIPPPPPPPPVNGFQGQQQNYVQPQANGFQGQQQQFIPPPPPPPPVNAMQQQNYVQPQANGFQGQQQNYVQPQANGFQGQQQNYVQPQANVGLGQQPQYQYQWQMLLPPPPPPPPPPIQHPEIDESQQSSAESSSDDESSLEESSLTHDEVKDALQSAGIEKEKVKNAYKMCCAGEDSRYQDQTQSVHSQEINALYCYEAIASVFRNTDHEDLLDDMQEDCSRALHRLERYLKNCKVPQETMLAFYMLVNNLKNSAFSIGKDGDEKEIYVIRNDWRKSEALEGIKNVKNATEYQELSEKLEDGYDLRKILNFTINYMVYGIVLKENSYGVLGTLLQENLTTAGGCLNGFIVRFFEFFAKDFLNANCFECYLAETINNCLEKQDSIQEGTEKRYKDESYLFKINKDGKCNAKNQCKALNFVEQILKHSSSLVGGGALRNLANNGVLSSTLNLALTGDVNGTAPAFWGNDPDTAIRELQEMRHYIEENGDCKNFLKNKASDMIDECKSKLNNFENNKKEIKKLKFTIDDNTLIFIVSAIKAVFPDPEVPTPSNPKMTIEEKLTELRAHIISEKIDAFFSLYGLDKLYYAIPEANQSKESLKDIIDSIRTYEKSNKILKVFEKMMK